MAPENALEAIKNVLISTTKSGYQDHKTCLESYKILEKALKTRKVFHPGLTPK